MKKVLWWVTFVPLAIVVILAATVGLALGKVEDWVERYEAWAFDCDAAGWERKDGVCVRRQED